MTARMIEGTWLAGLLLVGLTLAAGEKTESGPDKTVEIRGGAAGFVEKGKTKSESVTIVVGQTVRWQNRDETAHSVTSDLKYEGKPVLDTGIIEPGKHKDILIDINLYRRAGGKTAGAVTLTYRSAKNPERKGKIVLVSAAKRGGFGR